MLQHRETAISDCQFSKFRFEAFIMENFVFGSWEIGVPQQQDNLPIRLMREHAIGPLGSVREFVNVAPLALFQGGAQ